MSTETRDLMRKPFRILSIEVVENRYYQVLIGDNIFDEISVYASGKSVDALIKAAEEILSVDSKDPKEQKIIKAVRKRFERALAIDRGEIY